MNEEFQKHPFFPYLGARTPGFEFIIDHLSKQTSEAYIIETGTARIKDNWTGDGQSTLIWDWCLERNPALKCISIDLTPEYVEIAKSQTKNVQYICSDSVKALNEMDESIVRKIKLLYLDSFDWSPEMNLESAFHHMAELATVWKLLPDDCLIVVDDCHAPLQGKHVLIQYYLAKQFREPAFAGYQTGWFKSK